MTPCLLEEDSPLCFGFVHIINFCLFSLVHHTWVFMQMFVESDIGQMFDVPFDVTMSL